jgi:hypothetical protein
MQAIVVPDIFLQHKGMPTVICSVIPKKLISKRPNLRTIVWEDRDRTDFSVPFSRGITVFQMPAAERNSYSLCPVWSAMEYVYHPDKWGDGQKPSNQTSYNGHEKPSLVLAQELVEEWSGGVGLPAGVGVIKGLAPTPEELVAIRAKHSAKMEALVLDADKLATRGLEMCIGQPHQEALLWLGQTRAWQKPTGGVKQCPVCGSMMQEHLIFCASCKTNLVTFSRSLQEADPDYVETDPAVLKFLPKKGTDPVVKVPEPERARVKA